MEHPNAEHTLWYNFSGYEGAGGVVTNYDFWNASREQQAQWQSLAAWDLMWSAWFCSARENYTSASLSLPNNADVEFVLNELIASFPPIHPLPNMVIQFPFLSRKEENPLPPPPSPLPSRVPHKLQFKIETKRQRVDNAADLPLSKRARLSFDD